MSLDLFGQFKSRVAIMDQELFNFVEFDALISATYTGNTQVTDHPVEGQLDMTDHIRRLPTELQVRGLVTNFPAVILASFFATPAVPGTDPTARAEAAFNFLEAARQGAQLMHVVTSLWDLENMAITALACTRDKESSNIVDIALTLREIQIAATQTVEVSAPKNLGKRTKTVAPGPAAEKAGSVLSKLFSLFG